MSDVNLSISYVSLVNGFVCLVHDFLRQFSSNTDNGLIAYPNFLISLAYNSFDLNLKWWWQSSFILTRLDICEQKEILKNLEYNQRTNGPVNAHLISGPIRFLKVFTINEHGGHLGHVTCTYYINFLSHFPRRLNRTLAKLFQSRCLIIMVTYMYIAPGQGQTTPWGQILFVNTIIQSIMSFAAKFQDHELLVQEKIFLRFLPYMGMAAILVV